MNIEHWWNKLTGGGGGDGKEETKIYSKCHFVHHKSRIDPTQKHVKDRALSTLVVELQAYYFIHDTQL